jgi:membrane protein required for beta-lactamase induction
MSSNYLVKGTVTVDVQAWIQAANEDDAQQDFMLLCEMAIRDGLREDDQVADFRWTAMTIEP